MGNTKSREGKERRMAVYQIGDAINRKGEGKVGMTRIQGCV